MEATSEEGPDLDQRDGAPLMRDWVVQSREEKAAKRPL